MGGEQVRNVSRVHSWWPQSQASQLKHTDTKESAHCWWMAVRGDPAWGQWQGHPQYTLGKGLCPDQTGVLTGWRCCGLSQAFVLQPALLWAVPE